MDPTSRNQHTPSSRHDPSELDRTVGFTVPPQRSPEEILASIGDAVAKREDATACMEFFEWMVKSSLSDEIFTNSIATAESRAIYENQISPATMSLALVAGGQDFIDSTLQRRLNEELLINGKHTTASLYNVGHSGSSRFLPIAIELIEGPVEQRWLGLALVKYMARGSWHAPSALAALKLEQLYKSEFGEQSLRNLENMGHNCVAIHELQNVAELATPRAVAAICDHWDRFHQDYRKKSDGITNANLLQAFVTLVAVGAPGALAEVNARSESIRSVCDTYLASHTQSDVRLNPSGPSTYQLAKAALLGTSLDALPKRMAPEDFSPDKTTNWWLQNPYNAVHAVPPALECLCARGIEGAEQLLTKYMWEREEVLCQYLGQCLEDEPQIGETSIFSHYGLFELLEFSSEKGGANVLRMLERLQEEPWKVFDRMDWVRSANGLISMREIEGTRAHVDIVQAQCIPAIRRAQYLLQIKRGIMPG